VTPLNLYALYKQTDLSIYKRTFSMSCHHLSTVLTLAVSALSFMWSHSALSFIDIPVFSFPPSIQGLCL